MQKTPGRTTWRERALAFMEADCLEDWFCLAREEWATVNRTCDWFLRRVIPDALDRGRVASLTIGKNVPARARMDLCREFLSSRECGVRSLTVVVPSWRVAIELGRALQNGLPNATLRRVSIVLEGGVEKPEAIVALANAVGKLSSVKLLELHLDRSGRSFFEGLRGSVCPSLERLRLWWGGGGSYELLWFETLAESFPNLKSVELMPTPAPENWQSHLPFQVIDRPEEPWPTLTLFRHRLCLSIQNGLAESAVQRPDVFGRVLKTIRASIRGLPDNVREVVFRVSTVHVRFAENLVGSPKLENLAREKGLNFIVQRQPKVSEMDGHGCEVILSGGFHMSLGSNPMEYLTDLVRVSPEFVHKLVVRLTMSPSRNNGSVRALANSVKELNIALAQNKNLVEIAGFPIDCLPSECVFDEEFFRPARENRALRCMKLCADLPNVRRLFEAGGFPSLERLQLHGRFQNSLPWNMTPIRAILRKHPSICSVSVWERTIRFPENVLKLRKRKASTLADLAALQIPCCFWDSLRLDFTLETEDLLSPHTCLGSMCLQNSTEFVGSVGFDRLPRGPKRL